MNLPTAGPKNGAPENIHIANPRWDLSNMSAITPGALDIGADPIDPTKNLSTSNAAILPAPAAPALNAVATMKLRKKIFRLP